MASEPRTPWDKVLTSWHVQARPLGSINYVHLHLLWGFFRSVHLALPFSQQFWHLPPTPPWLSACLSWEAGRTWPNLSLVFLEFGCFSKPRLDLPGQGSCVFLHTFHHFCQLMSGGQLVIYYTGLAASRIPSQTLWSKKGSRRAQKASRHQTKGSEAYDSVFLLLDNRPDGFSPWHSPIHLQHKPLWLI